MFPVESVQERHETVRSSVNKRAEYRLRVPVREGPEIFFVIGTS